MAPSSRLCQVFLVLPFSHMLKLAPIGWMVLFALSSACGLTSSSELDDVDSTEEPAECAQGDVRLSDTSCGDTGLLIESCEAEHWVLRSEECVAEPVCEDGEKTATGEPLGGYFLNEALVECSGGTAQITRAACGSVEPTGGDNANFGVVDNNGRVDELAGVTFPFLMGFGPGGSATDLSHVLCADTVWTTGAYPELPHLFGVRSLTVNAPGQMGQFGALRKIEFLEVESTDDDGFAALGPLEELRSLRVRNTTMLSVSGLERITEMDSLVISGNEELVSLEGLSALRSVRGDLSLDDLPQMGLAGLENLETVGETLRLPIPDEEALQVLSNLASVGGDLELVVDSTDLSCAVLEFAQGLEIGGELVLAYANSTNPGCAP